MTITWEAVSLGGYVDLKPIGEAYGEDFAESAEVRGVSYERLLERILALGLRWEPARTG